MTKLYVYDMSTADTDDVNEMTYVDVIEGASWDDCYSKAEDKYSTNEYCFSNLDNGKRKWGGAREGAGRPATGRRKRTLYINDDEYKKLTKHLAKLRN